MLVVVVVLANEKVGLDCQEKHPRQQEKRRETQDHLSTIIINIRMKKLMRRNHLTSLSSLPSCC